MKSANQLFTRRAIGLIASYVLLGPFACNAQPASLEISGTLEDAAGKRVTGGFVKVVNQTSQATSIVSSGADGTYKTPGIAPGVYMIQAYGADRQSEAVGPLDMRAGSHRIALKMTIPFSPVSIPEGSTDSELAAAMPDGPAKGAIVSRCTTCHRLQWILSARKTPAEWKQTVERMRDNRQGSTRPLNEINGEEDLIRLDNIASYLAKELHAGYTSRPARVRCTANFERRAFSSQPQYPRAPCSSRYSDRFGRKGFASGREGERYGRRSTRYGVAQ